MRKEAIHNLRHSGCSKAVAILELRDGVVFLEISDNGGGFPAGDAPAGHGLASMRERARRLGGKLEIESNTGGTAVRAKIPVGRSFLRSKVGENLSKLD